MYELNTVTYGIILASYLAVYVLRQIELDNSANQAILCDFYVDDLLTGANTVKEVTIIKNRCFSAIDWIKIV